MISAGSMYPIAFDVLDAAGTLTHAATVTLTITLPDGTTAIPVITDTAVSGQYRLACQTTIPGRYTAHAVTTSPVTSWDDEFDVSPTPWPAMVSLNDAKSQLNMDPADHRFDDDLRDFIASATGAAEAYKREVIVRRTVTDQLDLSRLGCTLLPGAAGSGSTPSRSSPSPPSQRGTARHLGRHPDARTPIRADPGHGRPARSPASPTSPTSPGTPRSPPTTNAAPS